MGRETLNSELKQIFFWLVTHLHHTDLCLPLSYMFKIKSPSTFIQHESELRLPPLCTHCALPAILEVLLTSTKI